MGFASRIGGWFKKWFLAGGVGSETIEASSAFLGGVPSSPFSGHSHFASDGSKYFFGLDNSGLSPLLDNQRIRQNARKAYHDSVAARGLVDRYADTVVDVGLRLDAMPLHDFLGITADEAEEWATKVERLFDLWAKNKKSFRDETMNFYQGQRLAEISQQRDGEYFPRLYYTKFKDGRNPLQVSFVDPNQIRGDAFTSTHGFNVQTDGIKRDKNGKEIAYKIWVTDQKGIFTQVTVPALGPKSKRRMMLHGFAPEYAGQGRGYSRLAHALQEFADLTTFTISQIKKAIAQSQITMWVEPSDDNPASDPMAGISHRVSAGPMGETTPLSEEATDVLDALKYEELPEATIGQPGQVGVFNLNSGEKLRTLDGKTPAESYPQFVEAFLMALSASTSMPIEVLLMKFGQNYSASRGTLILFWRIAMIWRHELASDFLSPVYEEWLTGEIAAGRVNAPGWLDPQLRQAWLNHQWFGAPMPNIDPLRTSKADKEYIEMGAQTLGQTARNHNGSDGATNRIKLAKELAELPVPNWAKKNKTGASSAPDEDEETEDE
jgi:lambda family phage portal protein